MEEVNQSNSLNGFPNIGNTCYMNAALQCLKACKELTIILKKHTHIELVYFYINLIGMNSNPNMENIPINIRIGNFKMSLNKIPCFNMFRTNHPHDSHEFIVAFFDYLCETIYENVNTSSLRPDIHLTDDTKMAINDWLFAFKNKYSDIAEIFYGQYMSTVQCAHNHKSKRFDPFQILELNVLDDPNVNTKTDLSFSIVDCIQFQMRPNNITEYNCEKCNHVCEAEKTLTFFRLPHILVIKVSRWNFDGEHIIKTLILNEYLNFSPENRYMLFACVCHIGNRDGGHYISLIKHTDNCAYKIDDMSVEKQTPEQASELITRFGYMFFYKKQM